MQLASLGFQSGLVDRVAKQRVDELDVDAIEAHQRGLGQRGRIVVVVVDHALQSRQRGAMSEHGGGLQSRVIARRQSSGARQYDRAH